MSSEETDAVLESEQTEEGVMATVQTAIDGLRDSAAVSRVFGDPMEVNGRTIVPVAKVTYGFGGGYGSNGTDDADDEGSGEGSGGGGGASISPTGVVEVTDDGTRFVRFSNWRRIAAAVGAGVALGVLLGRW